MLKGRRMKIRFSARKSYVAILDGELPGSDLDDSTMAFSDAAADNTTIADDAIITDTIMMAGEAPVGSVIVASSAAML